MMRWTTHWHGAADKRAGRDRSTQYSGADSEDLLVSALTLWQ